MPIILCIETTSTNCSVALASGQGGFENSMSVSHCLDLLEDKSDSYSHGELLHVYIKELLSRNNLEISNVNAVAISKGPGSYTGLRIGVASAKGLCFAQDIPLISVDTLQALSLQVPQHSTVIPMMDARRMEVYSAVYVNGELKEKVAATILENDSFQKYLVNGDTVVIGTGAAKFQELLDDSANRYVSTVPTALTMCDLALQAYKKSDTVEDIAYFEPFYLKEFRSN